MGLMDKQTQQAFALGGFKDEGGEFDEKSGNRVPVGGTKKGVRDDIPANVSEGEFIFPEDVTRYIGLENLMNQRQEAKMGLQKMDAMGQMGNGDEATMPDDMPFNMADLVVVGGQGEPMEFADGGFVPSYQEGGAVDEYKKQPLVNSPLNLNNITNSQVFPADGYTTIGAGSDPVNIQPINDSFPELSNSKSGTETLDTAYVPTFTAEEVPDYESYMNSVVVTSKEYKNAEGETQVITFINGVPTTPIPEGYTLVAAGTSTSTGTVTPAAAVVNTVNTNNDKRFKDNDDPYTEPEVQTIDYNSMTPAEFAARMEYESSKTYQLGKGLGFAIASIIPLGGALAYASMRSHARKMEMTINNQIQNATSSAEKTRLTKIRDGYLKANKLKPTAESGVLGQFIDGYLVGKGFTVEQGKAGGTAAAQAASTGTLGEQPVGPVERSLRPRLRPETPETPEEKAARNDKVRTMTNDGRRDARLIEQEKAMAFGPQLPPASSGDGDDLGTAPTAAAPKSVGYGVGQVDPALKQAADLAEFNSTVGNQELATIKSETQPTQQQVENAQRTETQRAFLEKNYPAGGEFSGVPKNVPIATAPIGYDETGVKAGGRRALPTAAQTRSTEVFTLEGEYPETKISTAIPGLEGRAMGNVVLGSTSEEQMARKTRAAQRGTKLPDSKIGSADPVMNDPRKTTPTMQMGSELSPVKAPTTPYEVVQFPNPISPRSTYTGTDVASDADEIMTQTQQALGTGGYDEIKPITMTPTQQRASYGQGNIKPTVPAIKKDFASISAGADRFGSLDAKEKVIPKPIVQSRAQRRAGEMAQVVSLRNSLISNQAPVNQQKIKAAIKDAEKTGRTGSTIGGVPVGKMSTDSDPMGVMVNDSTGKVLKLRDINPSLGNALGGAGGKTVFRDAEGQRFVKDTFGRTSVVNSKGEIGGDYTGAGVVPDKTRNQPSKPAKATAKQETKNGVRYNKKDKDNNPPSKPADPPGNTGGFTSFADMFDGGGPGESAKQEQDRGGGDGSSSKIVCSAMNDAYGFGSFRNKIWLTHSKNNLTKEHQVGYHRIFLPLINIGYKKNNKFVRNCLEHIARHRTTDIYLQSKGNKRDTLGMVYRSILEPICYFVGLITTSNGKT